jgi:Fe-S-cluster containining protein
MDELLWYADGLRFECQRCGRCCTGDPGDVWVSEDESAALATHLGLTEAGLRHRHLKANPWRGLRLREKLNLDCTFFNRESGCEVYALRPRQCITWPFWRSSLVSPGAWAEAAAECPGMNRGTLYTFEEIRALSAADGLPDEE